MTTTSESLRKAFGYLTKNELPALKQLAQSLPDNPVVVNIGAGAGTSGLAFMESRADLFLYTVDIQRDSSPLGCLEAEEKVLGDSGVNLYIKSSLQSTIPRYKQYWARSSVIGMHWQQRHGDYYYPVFYDHNQVDMVFVDADHSYEACKGDIEAWLPNIKPGGIIALHDYKKHEVDDPDIHPKPWPGVDQAVDELLAGKYEQILWVDSLVAFRV